jgi:parallel beta-helix repeat protein
MTSVITSRGSLTAVWSAQMLRRSNVSKGPCASGTVAAFAETVATDPLSTSFAQRSSTASSAESGRTKSSPLVRHEQRVAISVLTILIGLVPTVTQSADYWVAPKGRDAPRLGDQKKPWATLQFAADRVKAGDSVHVLDGDYTGFYLSRGGSVRAPIRFIAEGEKVRITTRNKETPDGINIEGASQVIVDGFVINEMPRSGIRMTHSAHSTIRGIRADHNRIWGIFTSFCDDILIEGNTASRSIKEHGIYVSNSGDRPIIRGNVSRANRGCGIHMNGDASQGGDGIISGAVIENNVIFDNGSGGASGINCDGVQDSKIQNNLLYNNHANGISLYRIDGAKGSTGNIVINNTVVQASDARWAVNIKNRSSNNLVANNILFHNGSRGSINIAADSLSGFRSDHNIVVDRFSADDGDQFIRLAEWREWTVTPESSRPRMCSSTPSQAITVFGMEARRSTRPIPRSPLVRTSKEQPVRSVPALTSVPTKRTMARPVVTARAAFLVQGGSKTISFHFSRSRERVAIEPRPTLYAKLEPRPCVRREKAFRSVREMGDMKVIGAETINRHP